MLEQVGLQYRKVLLDVLLILLYMHEHIMLPLHTQTYCCSA